MTFTYILRVWMPDRPGALGQVASRVGAVGGDVVGIDILERGAGRAIDELVVELPDDDLVELLLTEMKQVDGVDVESITPAADALRDPRLDALETAAILVGASTRSSALDELCVHAARTVGAVWAAVVELESTTSSPTRATPPPSPGWWPTSTAASPRPRWPTATAGPPTSSGRHSRRRASPSCWVATAPPSVLGSGARRQRWRGSWTLGFAS